uniref:Talin central domain-containing protein n=1 Tax=Anguilla anguilla TaxID=7936 RepID=A0A0E9QY63_ANGAN
MTNTAMTLMVVSLAKAAVMSFTDTAARALAEACNRIPEQVCGPDSRQRHTHRPGTSGARQV